MTRRTARRVRDTRVLSESPDWSASKLRLLGVALVCAKVALVPLVFDNGADAPFTVPKALVSHALAYALSGVILGLFVQFGRSFVVVSWLHVPVLSFLGANVVATLFAVDSVLALYGAHIRMMGLGTVADGVVLYFAVVLLVRTRAEAVAVISTALAASAMVVAYELAQLARKDPFSWTVDSSLRPFSTIGQINNLAEYLTVLAIGAAAFALFDGRLRVPVRVLLLAWSGVLLAGVLPTLTRAALLGVVGGAALLATLTWVAHPSRRARAMSVFATALASVVVALALVFTPLGARILSTIEIPAPDPTGEETGPRIAESGQTRLALYRIALEMVRERPAFGYGPDNLAAGVPRYRSANEPSEIQQSTATSAHSWVAHVAAGSGLAGLGSFVAIAGVALALTFRAGFVPVAWSAAAMLAAFLGAGLITVNDISTEWLFWASVGAIAAATGRPLASVAHEAAGRPRGKPQPPRRVPRARRALGPLCAGLGLVMALTPASAFSAARAAHEAQELRFRGRHGEAIDPGLRATRSDPGRAEYWESLGLAYIGSQRVREAALAFERASELAPYNVRYDGELARAYLILVNRGDRASTARAREVAERAVRTDPNNPRAHYTRALVMQVTGDMPQALVSVERALALDPRSSNGRLYLTATQVMLANGRASDAIALARRAIATLPGGTVPIRTELARALATTGQTAQALAELDAVLAIRPNDAAAQQLRTQIRAGLPPQ